MTCPAMTTMPTSEPSTVNPSSGALSNSSIWTGTTFCFLLPFPSPPPEVPPTLNRNQWKIELRTNAMLWYKPWWTNCVVHEPSSTWPHDSWSWMTLLWKETNVSNVYLGRESGLLTASRKFLIWAECFGGLKYKVVCRISPSSRQQNLFWMSSVTFNDRIWIE